MGWKGKHAKGSALQFLGVFVFMVFLPISILHVASVYGSSNSPHGFWMYQTYMIAAIAVSTPIIVIGSRLKKKANEERMMSEFSGYVSKRPSGVTILGIINAIAGIITIYDGVSRAQEVLRTPFLGPLLFQIPFFRDALSMYVAIVVMMGVFYFVIAGSLFSGKNWGRELVRLLAIFGGLSSLLSILFGNLVGILYLLGYWIVYWYTGRRNVEEYFFFNSMPKSMREELQHGALTPNVSSTTEQQASHPTRGTMPKGWKAATETKQVEGQKTEKNSKARKYSQTLTVYKNKYDMIKVHLKEGEKISGSITREGEYLFYLTNSEHIKKFEKKRRPEHMEFYEMLESRGHSTQTFSFDCKIEGEYLLVFLNADNRTIRVTVNYTIAESAKNKP